MSPTAEIAALCQALNALCNTPVGMVPNLTEKVLRISNELDALLERQRAELTRTEVKFLMN